MRKLASPDLHVRRYVERKNTTQNLNYFHRIDYKKKKSRDSWNEKKNRQSNKDVRKRELMETMVYF